MNTQRTPRSDKELWRSLASQPAVAPGAVSEMELAAWLEAHHQHLHQRRFHRQALHLAGDLLSDLQQDLGN